MVQRRLDNFQAFMRVTVTSQYNGQDNHLSIQNMNSGSASTNMGGFNYKIPMMPGPPQYIDLKPQNGMLRGGRPVMDYVRLVKNGYSQASIDYHMVTVYLKLNKT